MSELKKRAAIRLGFTMSMQDIDPDTDAIVNDHVVNNWGGAYERLEVEEAVLFEAYLDETCGADFDIFIAKVRKAAKDFGLETIIGIPAGSNITEAGREMVRGNSGK